MRGVLRFDRVRHLKRGRRQTLQSLQDCKNGDAFDGVGRTEEEPVNDGMMVVWFGT